MRPSFGKGKKIALLQVRRFHQLSRFFRGPQIQVLCNLNSLVFGGVLVNELSVNVPFNLFVPGTMGKSS
jgi:hypothetical protein